MGSWTITRLALTPAVETSNFAWWVTPLRSTLDPRFGVVQNIERSSVSQIGLQDYLDTIALIGNDVNLPNNTVAPLPPPKQVRLNIYCSKLVWLSSCRQNMATPNTLRLPVRYQLWTWSNSKPRLITHSSYGWLRTPQLFVTRATLHHKLASDPFTYRPNKYEGPYRYVPKGVRREVQSVESTKF